MFFFWLNGIWKEPFINGCSDTEETMHQNTKKEKDYQSFPKSEMEKISNEPSYNNSSNYIDNSDIEDAIGMSTRSGFTEDIFIFA